MLRTPTRRPGFTLVELMVAAAVCVLIMAVLATAFQLGIDTMRQLRSTGEMMDQLRGAVTALKTDLKTPHLIDSNGLPVRLSSFRWDQCMIPPSSPGSFKVQVRQSDGSFKDWSAPTAGFMRIGNGFGPAPTQANPTTSVAVYEGSDPDGLASFRATNHYLHFTSVQNGLSEEEYYYATIPGVPPFSSTAAEIAYFLDPLGQINGGVTTFRLIRRQRLVALNDTNRRDRRWPQVFDTSVFSFRPTGGNPPFFLNTMQEITDPLTRLSQSFTTVPSGTSADGNLAPMATRPGEDTLLSNVLSFEVQVIYVLPSATPPAPNLPVPTVVGAPRQFGTTETALTTSSFPFDFLPQAPATGNNTPGLADPMNKNGMCVYDSWSMNYAGWVNSVDQKTGAFIANPQTPPLLAWVRAVQIRIRVWDPKLQNARQATFIQEL